MCLTFVFGALLEFALVNYASRSDLHRDQLQKQRQWEEFSFDDQATFPMVCQAFPETFLEAFPEGFPGFLKTFRAAFLETFSVAFTE